MAEKNLKSFDQFELPAELQKALSEMEFVHPTPVQEKALPIILAKRDLMGTAQTGSGKTAAFAIPLVAEALRDPKKRFLVLAPTRELAAQIRDVFVSLLRFSPQIRTALIVGGAQMGRQKHTLSKKPHFILATPGRLNDHLKRRSADLSTCGVVVLDEADRMLDMGFGPQIEQILSFVTSKRQTLLFSATLPPKIKKLAENHLSNPESIELDPVDQANQKIEQSFVRVRGRDKPLRLIDLLKETSQKTLVFARTKRGADKLRSHLDSEGVRATCIHGDRSQGQRERAIADFRSGRQQVMVATDIAARGLDVDQIKLVVNYDLPETVEDYIHRIGRTGRAGESGRSISFVNEGEEAHSEYLQDPRRGSPMKRGARRKPSGPRKRGLFRARKPANTSWKSFKRAS